MQTSPSPCAACASPAEKSAPGLNTGKIERGSRAQLAHVHVAAEDSRRPRAKFAVFRARHAHHPAKRTQRHDGRERAIG